MLSIVYFHSDPERNDCGTDSEISCTKKRPEDPLSGLSHSFFHFYRAALPGTNAAAPRLYADVAAAVDFSINNPAQTGFFHVPVALSLNRTIAAVHYSVCPSTIHILKQVDFYVNNICAFYLPDNTISNDKYTKVLSLFFAL